MTARLADKSVQYRCGLTNKVTWIDLTDTLTWITYFTVVVNEDTSQQMLLVEHRLDADITEDDTVTFEVSFVPKSQWGNVNTSVTDDLVGEDAGRCELSIKSDDLQFWDVTLTDIYYKCTGTSATTTGTNEPQTTVCSASDNNYNSNSVLSESSANNQWTTPYNDEDRFDPWCTRIN